MLQKETKVFTFDNSGAYLLKCIHIMGTKKYGFVGDLIKVVIKKFKKKKKLIKKQIYYGLVVCTTNLLYRLEGMYIKSDVNKILVLNKDNKQFLGTRISGPVYKEICQIVDGKKKLVRYEKIISLTKKLI